MNQQVRRLGLVLGAHPFELGRTAAGPRSEASPGINASGKTGNSMIWRGGAMSRPLIAVLMALSLLGCERNNPESPASSGPNSTVDDVGSEADGFGGDLSDAGPDIDGDGGTDVPDAGSFSPDPDGNPDPNPDGSPGPNLDGGPNPDLDSSPGPDSGRDAGDDGICSLGEPCNDMNRCTMNDACNENGECVGGPKYNSLPVAATGSYRFTCNPDGILGIRDGQFAGLTTQGLPTDLLSRELCPNPEGSSRAEPCVIESFLVDECVQADYGQVQRVHFLEIRAYPTRTACNPRCLLEPCGGRSTIAGAFSVDGEEWFQPFEFPIEGGHDIILSEMFFEEPIEARYVLVCRKYDGDEGADINVDSVRVEDVDPWNSYHVPCE